MRRWRVSGGTKGAEREGFEALHDGSEVEFVTRARKRPEPLETVVLSSSARSASRHAFVRLANWRMPWYSSSAVRHREHPHGGSRWTVHASAVVQHFARIGHPSQSRFNALWQRACVMHRTADR
jgi:hypothetical protein